MRTKKLAVINIVYFAISILVAIDVLRNSLLQYSSFSYIYTILQYIAIVTRIAVLSLGLFFYFRYRHVMRENVILVLSFCIIAITVYTQKTFAFFDLFFLPITVGPKLRYNKTITAFLNGMVSGTILVFILYFVNAFPAYSVTRDNGRFRTSLGFAHPNTLGHIIMFICLLIILQDDNKHPKRNIAICLLTSIWLYRYPNSMTSALVLVMLVIAIIFSKTYALFFRQSITNSMFIRVVALISVPTIIAIVYSIIMRNLGEYVLSDLSTTLTSRVLMATKGIAKYGIHLINTQEIEFAGTVAKYFKTTLSGYFVVDCLYIYVFLVFGVIPGIYYFAFLINSIRITYIQRKEVLLIVLAVLCIYALTESTFTSFKSAFIFLLPVCFREEVKSKLRKENE